MQTLNSLYETAECDGIDIWEFPLPECGSIAIQLNTGCCIGLDYSLLGTTALEKSHLAHELGHCETGSFYNRYSPLESRQRHENRADKWAIHALIPEAELKQAVAAGYTEVWELAEQFEVSEWLMKRAISWYQHGTLNSD